MRLQIGNNHPVALRRESCRADCAAPFSVLYLSDFHLTAGSDARAGRILWQAADARPDLILLGGDYADSRGGLRITASLTSALVAHAPVLAIAGNHDRIPGMARTRTALEGAGAQWIEGRHADLEIAGTTVRVSGSAIGPPAANAAVSILCQHNPRFSAAVAQYDLAIAGHLHGGQCVLWETGAGLFPGRLFYRWNRRSVRIGDCACFISTGLGDTVPLRYNCPREMILIRITPIHFA